MCHTCSIQKQGVAHLVLTILQTNSECNRIAIDRIIVFEKWRCLVASKDGKTFTT